MVKLNQKFKLRNSSRSKSNHHYFCFLVPEDNYFQAIMYSLINHILLNNSTNSTTILIIPTYGIRFKEPLKSKFPKLLKYITNGLRYIQSEFKRYKNIHSKTKLLVECNGNHKIKIIPPIRFFLYLILDNLVGFYQYGICKKQRNAVWTANYIPSQQKIKIKDLIIDSYLRYAGVPVFNKDDIYVSNLENRAQALALFYSNIFNKLRGNKYAFTSYTSYIHAGLFARLAATSNLKLVTLGSVVSYYKIHNNFSKHLPTHQDDHQSYSVENACTLPTELLAEAEENLINRTKGNYTNSMNYMMTSKKLVDNDSNKDSELIFTNKIILMLHDFFDSPHVYDWMLFDDLWQWAYETIEFCDKNSLKIAIKPHPNQTNGNQDVIDELRALFKNSEFVKWIPNTVPNSLILASKPKMIVTVYGSVIAEAAYCHIPSIAAGDHPAINFNLAYTAKTQENYFEALASTPQISFDARKQAIAFTALRYKNIFTKYGDSLASHLNHSMADFVLDPGLLQTTEANQYMNKMSSLILNHLIA